MTVFFTIGHSNRGIEEFVALLREAEIDGVVDVRRLPGSQRYPWFDQDRLAQTLQDHEVTYRHEMALTGRRPKQPDIDDHINGFWENRSFHNYADYALSEEFRNGLDRLPFGAGVRPALLCSEAVWWRCHRRIIADHLLARGEQVFHVMGAGTMSSAVMTAGAVVHPDGSVTYPWASPRSPSPAA